jgi:predicted nucleotidyltransferase component of viral defense system
LIEEKFVDLYARNSGIRDKLIAERDVVLTYALKALMEAKLASQLAFKGGTCLRKLVFGSAGRFSEDLDYTMATDKKPDDILVRVIEIFNGEHYGIRFTLDDHYQSGPERSFGGDVRYRHAWNDAGRFHLQISLREEPTLSLASLALKPQAYFKYLEFKPFEVRTLQPIEMVSEKIRAAYQRVKVRDLYDLFQFASTPFDGELLRRLVVLKLWQARDPFDPDSLLAKIAGSAYQWEDLRRLVHANEKLDPAAIKKSVIRRLDPLRHLSELERQVVADSRAGRGKKLADQLRKEIRALAGPC